MPKALAASAPERHAKYLSFTSTAARGVSGGKLGQRFVQCQHVNCGAVLTPVFSVMALVPFTSARWRTLLLNLFVTAQNTMGRGMLGGGGGGPGLPPPLPWP